MSVIFITGIDTGVGKTYVTGALARYLKDQGKSVITCKLVQTGSTHPPEDLLMHRQFMQESLHAYDQQGITCPYVFSYPASPHLAAGMENKTINPDKIDQATDRLTKEFEYVLMEGAGGICVPLTPSYTILDFLTERRYPCVVVSSPKLGSINHTLLTLEMLANKNVPVLGICYSLAIPSTLEITKNTEALLRERYPHLPFVFVPFLNIEKKLVVVDFSSFKLET
ncbi:ATP-dependent dethiobiotin synthetase BioD [bacterium]|nr:ATP-dependent dethiobiotin synthetase BioD [bacterium]